MGKLRTESSCNYVGSILLKLSQLIPRTSIASIAPSIELDNRRVVGTQRDFVLYRVGELEKSRIGVYRREEVTRPSPALGFNVLLGTTLEFLLLVYRILRAIQTEAV